MVLVTFGGFTSGWCNVDDRSGDDHTLDITMLVGAGKDRSCTLSGWKVVIALIVCPRLEDISVAKLRESSRTRLTGSTSGEAV